MPAAFVQSKNPLRQPSRNIKIQTPFKVPAGMAGIFDLLLPKIEGNYQKILIINVK
jgi:hypothetical protein